MTSKQRKPKLSTDETSVQSMRHIFSESQRLDKMDNCMNQMSLLQTVYSKTKKSIKGFYEEFIRNIKYTLYVHDWRSPYGQNSIAFIIQYLLNFDKMCGEDNNEDMKNDFIDTVLEDVVIPYLNSKKPECRINACNLIRRLADHLEDISDETFDNLRKALLDRSIDKISSVRAAAILALHRFQDVNNENDLVIQAIHFHLNNDPDYEVRLNCLKTMATIPISFKHFISATRDIKDFIRKSAYLQICEKLTINCFKIDERLTILKNGLKDRSPAVRKVVESVLIPTWIDKCCNSNLIELLIKLDIQTDIELIEKILEIYFKSLNSEKLNEELDKTKLNQLIDVFCETNLSKERVFKVTLNVENIFLWRFLCEYCKTNQIQSPELIDNENTQNSIDTQNEELMSIEDFINEVINTSEQTLIENRIQKVDSFDLLVPDVPIFCTYLEKFVNSVIQALNTEEDKEDNDNELCEEGNITDALDYEFIFNQFMIVALLLDIGDDSQRNILKETLRKILVNNNIGDKFHNYISPIMKCLAKKCFSDNNKYLEFTVEIISEITSNEMNETNDENETQNDENKEMEEKRDQIIADIEKCKNDAKDLENEEKLSEAEELYKKIEELELDLKNIREKITLNTLSQFSQSSQTPRSTSFTDLPKVVQMRCLYIFSGCLEFGDFDGINAVMQTHVENVCLVGFLSDSAIIRYESTRCLGLVCLTSPQYFKKYLHLLIQIFSKDIESIKVIALECIFDSLCEHGINIFKDSSKEIGSGEEIFVNTDDDFITSFKQFFCTQLDSENIKIRQTSVQGVSKLLINSRIYSPELLSKLVIILFTPNENQQIIQLIGNFLHYYSLAESQNVIVGQSALEETFIITLQTIYENNLRLNTENIIKYFLKLIADESHLKLAEDLIKKISETLESNQTKFVEEYLLSAVSQLNLIEMEYKDLKSFEENINLIENKLENSKSKKLKQKLLIIKKNIENRSQQLSADSAFADDFKSVDDNNDNREEEIEDLEDQPFMSPTNIFEKQCIGSDSDADSFKTCPESPLQKRRRISSDNCLTNESTKENNSEVMNDNNIDIEMNETLYEDTNEELDQCLEETDEQTISDQRID